MAGGAHITISMTVVGGPGSRITRTLTDDARAMCAAARTILDEAEHQGRRPPGVRHELEQEFGGSKPTAAGTKLVERLALVEDDEDVPAAWRKALVGGGVAVADAACPDLDRLLGGG